MLIYPRQLLAIALITSLSTSYIVAQESVHLVEEAYYYPKASENFEERLFGIVLSETSRLEELDEHILLLSLIHI